MKAALAVLALLALLDLNAFSKDVEKLSLGDPAPTLKLTGWLTGQPLDLKQAHGKQVVVLIFWEVSCPACLATLEQISKIQKAFSGRNVVFIGISAEPPVTVKPFVESHRALFEFAVALDEKKETFHDYMLASDQGIVPQAFVIDQNSVLAWRGHPLGGLEEALGQIVTGQYDLESAKRADQAQKSVLEYVEIASTNLVTARALGERIIRDAKDKAWVLNDFAWTVLMSTRLKDRDIALAKRAAAAAYDYSGTYKCQYR
jgi:peroxiredoxin